MRKRERWAAPLAAVFALYVAACADPQEVSQIKEKVDVIGAQQKDVLSKLEALAKGQKDILAKAPAAAAPSKPQEDPNKVYKIDVGDSYFKGPKDAPIVMVEWSDFQ
jgi:protein-disulfide isomerase